MKQKIMNVLDGKVMIKGILLLYLFTFDNVCSAC